MLARRVQHCTNAQTRSQRRECNVTHSIEELADLPFVSQTIARAVACYIDTRPDFAHPSRQPIYLCAQFEDPQADYRLVHHPCNYLANLTATLLFEMASTRAATGNSKPRVFTPVSTEPTRKTAVKKRAPAAKKSTTAGVTKPKTQKRKPSVKDKVVGAVKKAEGVSCFYEQITRAMQS